MQRLLTLLAFISGSLVFAEARPEILNRIRDYDMRHSDLLVKIVKDPETLRYAKVRALEKMSVIYQQSPIEGEKTVAKYLDGIHAGLLHKSPDVREAACSSVVVFQQSPTGPQFAAAAIKTLKDEMHPGVIAACAQSLRFYPKDAVAIVPALLVRLDKYLTEFQDSAADEKALREICRTLKVMKSRKAFIPLLKLLQSRYDESVKSVAQEAIQALQIN